MVRRLVKQQQIGLAEQQRRQCNAHFPPARIAVERAVLHLFVKAETHQNPRSARGCGMGINRDQPLVNLPDAVMIVGCFFLGQQCRAFGIGL